MTPHVPPAPHTAVDRSSALPLWAQVQTDLERRLRRGEFDDAFPGELALVDTYGVSRHTVREALRRLRASGLVEAARGRAPRVVEGEIAQVQGNLYSLFTAVEQSGRSQRSLVRHLDARADGTVARRLDLEESTPLIHLERVRLADDEPLAVDRVWLPAQVAAPLLDADFSRTSLYGELDHRCGVRLTGGREEVRAVVPTPAERVLLGLDEGVAALEIDRLGTMRGRPVEWRRTLIRADRFSLVTDLGRTAGHEVRTTGLLRPGARPAAGDAR
jgi:GntR family transcriptional regulator